MSYYCGLKKLQNEKQSKKHSNISSVKTHAITGDGTDDTSYDCMTALTMALKQAKRNSKTAMNDYGSNKQYSSTSLHTLNERSESFADRYTNEQGYTVDGQHLGHLELHAPIHR